MFNNGIDGISTGSCSNFEERLQSVLQPWDFLRPSRPSLVNSVFSLKCRRPMWFDCCTSRIATSHCQMMSGCSMWDCAVKAKIECLHEIEFQAQRPDVMQLILRCALCPLSEIDVRRRPAHPECIPPSCGASDTPFKHMVVGHPRNHL